MSQPDDQHGARRETAGPNSEHAEATTEPSNLDEAGRGTADASDRDEATEAESSLVDEVKEKVGDLWDTVTDTVSAVKEGYDEGGPDETGTSHSPSNP